MRHAISIVDRQYGKRNGMFPTLDALADSTSRFPVWEQKQHSPSQDAKTCSNIGFPVCKHNQHSLGPDATSDSNLGLSVW